MTEVTPALRSCWMTSGAWVLVVAESLGSEAMVLTVAVIPARRRSGRRYCLRASWSEARSPTSTPTLWVPPSRAELRPQLTTACRMTDWSGPVHHR